MRAPKNRTWKLLPALTLSLAACGPMDAAEEAVGQDDVPVSGYNDVFEGAPANSALPNEMKADVVYPKQHQDLLAFQSPVKSQGSRGVCSIFATVALMEHLYLKANQPSPDFSEQYLQWSVKSQIKAFPGSSGSSGDANLRAIVKYGVPAEEAWPYETYQWGTGNDPECTGKDPMPTKCYTNGEPPETAKQAKKFFLPANRWLNTNSIKDQIYTKKQGVIVGLDFFYQAWNHRRSTLPTSGANWNKGYVTYPNDEDVEASHKQRAGHAIHVLGWDDELEVQKRDKDGNGIVDANGKPVMEKGFYLFKNSWGTAGFGIDNPAGAGYGWISMKYVEEYGSAVAADLPKLDNPPPPPVGTPKEASFSGTVAKDQQLFHSVALAATAQKIKVQMTGTGDADLYTKLGAAPTKTTYDCRPYKAGSSETCEVATGTGSLEIMVIGWAKTSDYKIKVSWTE